MFIGISTAAEIKTFRSYELSINYSCSSNTDCVIQDIKNCCGSYPKCTNANAIVNTSLVEELCKNQSTTSCNVPTINSCKCQYKKCVGVSIKNNNTNNLVGNDSDSHGCKGSAGYSWCEEKQKCLRSWEENCNDVDDKNDEIPKCISIGSESESWSYNGKNEWALCSDCIPVCKAIGSRSEGWYAECKDESHNKLISYTNCGKYTDNLPGQDKVKILPETASARARERLGELGFNVTLKEVGKGNETKTIYEARAKKEGKLFGFLKVKGDVSAEIDAETGEVKKVHKPWWGFMAGI